MALLTSGAIRAGVIRADKVVKCKMYRCINSLFPLSLSIRTRMKMPRILFQNRYGRSPCILCIRHFGILFEVVDGALLLVFCIPNILPRRRYQNPSFSSLLLWLHTCISYLIWILLLYSIPSNYEMILNMYPKNVDILLASNPSLLYNLN